jgi:hypothetical protein
MSESITPPEGPESRREVSGTGIIPPPPDGGAETTRHSDPDATVPPAPPSLPVGAESGPGKTLECFGRYRILRRLGQGGMGTVYEAHDTQLDRLVALKVPRLALGESEELLVRFNREARIAATFSHPNLCPVYDFGQHEGTWYFTMPLLRGEPMTIWLGRHNPLAEQEAVRFTCRIALAMQAAHDAGVIHRDLKPANVMVKEDGEPMVMDFGLAWRDAPHDPRLTPSGIGVGTPAYAAPEQIDGRRQEVGPACDVYSLGVMLYEMLAGRPPFQGSVWEVLTQILTKEPPPPSFYRPGIDPRLEAICLRAMAKAPEERFASMKAFAAALQGEGEVIVLPSVPELPSRTKEAPTRARGRAVWLAVAGMALLAIAILAAAWYAQRKGETETPLDALQIGTFWKGPFRWVSGFQGKGGEVEVTITDRRGEVFSGTYSTGEGQYQWDIEGTVRGGEVRWRFTRVIREAFDTKVLETAAVSGRLEGQQMKLRYRDHNSSADMELELKEKE